MPGTVIPAKSHIHVVVLLHILLNTYAQIHRPRLPSTLVREASLCGGQQSARDA